MIENEKRESWFMQRKQYNQNERRHFCYSGVSAVVRS
jgi:hypothetical protein